MKTLLIAGMLSTLASGAMADDCKRYVRENDAEQWLTIQGDELRAHVKPEEKVIWRIRESEEDPGTPIRVAEVPDVENDVQTFAFRYVTLNGVEGLIANAVFYAAAPCK